MSDNGRAGELASARLLIPPYPSSSRRQRGPAATPAPQAIEASIHEDGGALLVTLRADPPPSSAATVTLPLLACLQFIAAFEEAAATALARWLPPLPND